MLRLQKKKSHPKGVQIQKKMLRNLDIQFDRGGAEIFTLNTPTKKRPTGAF